MTRPPEGTETRHPARGPGRGRLRLAALILAGGTLTCLLAGRDGSESPGPGPRFEPVFAADHLPEFELSVPQASYESLREDPSSYQPAHFRYRPRGHRGPAVVLPYVGLRLKGRASFHPIDRKPALKIKFDEYIKSQRFLGLRRLTLNNMDQDPSMVRERLSFHVFRRAGLPAPLCNHARVVLNGSYYGLYANVQTIDRVFIETRFSPARGNLYDLSRDHYAIDLEPRFKPLFSLKTNQALNRTADLDALLDAVGRPTPDFVRDVASIVDLDEWLAVGAVEAVVAHSDGYFANRNNYQLYHDVGRRGFQLLPWGCDQTLGINNFHFRFLMYRIDGARTRAGNGLFFRRCRESRECYECYLNHVEKAIEVWEGLDLEAELDGILAQISPSVYEDDRRPYSIQEFERSVGDVRLFLSERGRIVRRQLAAIRARLADR